MDRPYTEEELNAVKQEAFHMLFVCWLRLFAWLKQWRTIKVNLERICCFLIVSCCRKHTCNAFNDLISWMYWILNAYHGCIGSCMHIMDVLDLECISWMYWILNASHGCIGSWMQDTIALSCRRGHKDGTTWYIKSCHVCAFRFGPLSSTIFPCANCCGSYRKMLFRMLFWQHAFYAALPLIRLVAPLLNIPLSLCFF